MNVTLSNGYKVPENELYNTIMKIGSYNRLPTFSFLIPYLKNSECEITTNILACCLTEEYEFINPIHETIEAEPDAYSAKISAIAQFILQIATKSNTALVNDCSDIKGQIINNGGIAIEFIGSNPHCFWTPTGKLPFPANNTLSTEAWELIKSRFQLIPLHDSCNGTERIRVFSLGCDLDGNALPLSIRAPWKWLNEI